MLPTSLSSAAIRGSIGQERGPGEWLLVSQALISQFADCTQDHADIHVKQDLASQTWLGGTIAHGFLLLSLLVPMSKEIAFVPNDMGVGVNYGFDKIRFITPVRSGRRIRCSTRLLSAKQRPAGDMLITQAVSVEIEGSPKPALVAEWLTAWSP